MIELQLYRYGRVYRITQRHTGLAPPQAITIIQGRRIPEWRMLKGLSGLVGNAYEVAHFVLGQCGSGWRRIFRHCPGLALGGGNRKSLQSCDQRSRQRAILYCRQDRRRRHHKAKLHLNQRRQNLQSLEPEPFACRRGETPSQRRMPRQQTRRLSASKEQKHLGTVTFPAW